MGKTIKVIDLLNKMANGEAPKKIRFNGETLVLDNGKELCYRYEGKSSVLCFDWYIETRKLNTEVEVLEEDKGITKWGKGALEEIQTKKDYKINDLQKYIELLMVTQNEIIDRLDELKKEGNK